MPSLGLVPRFRVPIAPTVWIFALFAAASLVFVTWQGRTTISLHQLYLLLASLTMLAWTLACLIGWRATWGEPSQRLTTCLTLTLWLMGGLVGSMLGIALCYGR